MSGKFEEKYMHIVLGNRSMYIIMKQLYMMNMCMFIFQFSCLSNQMYKHLFYGFYTCRYMFIRRLIKCKLISPIMQLLPLIFKKFLFKYKFFR